MRTYSSDEPTPNQVMALFHGSALSFNLSKGATFADLADRLDSLGDRHTGSPMAIMMKFSAPQTNLQPAR